MDEREVLVKVLEAVRCANHELEGYFDDLAQEVNEDLVALNLDPLEIEGEE